MGLEVRFSANFGAGGLLRLEGWKLCHIGGKFKFVHFKLLESLAGCGTWANIRIHTMCCQPIFGAEFGLMVDRHGFSGTMETGVCGGW